jgi:epoxide hydrolase
VAAAHRPRRAGTRRPPPGFAVFGADETARRLVPAPPGAHWTEFPHAKHFPAMEAPADLAADLQAFFGPLS